MSSDIDAILKATEGHTPGPWRDVYAGSGDWQKLKEIGPLGMFGRSLAFASRASTCSHDHELIKAAPALRAEVVRLRERDAAWRWLADRHSDKLEGLFWDKDARIGEPIGNWKPDPVALATALDANWRKA